MSQPSPDARAVVRALADLTTQVRRLADYRQSDFALTPDADDAPTTTADDEATTPATTCSAQYHGPHHVPTQCIRAAHHEHPHHTDEGGFHWSDTVAVYPVAPAVRKVAQQVPAEAYTAWTEQAPAADEDAQHTTDEEQTLRLLRRESLLVLLTRLQRGRTLTETEADALRQHVETEIREADTARSVARSNLRHVKTIVPELEQAQAELQRYAEAESADAAAGSYAGRAEQAEAAIERVRALADQFSQEDDRGALGIGYRSAGRQLRAALDGTEQPTTTGD
ncbi:hypothetical protein [Streptomyces sp. NPDC008137]|uniref:hypothetical protein n=1 Tax=Streptomyces sp. NPDC008137 TaxID=3364813 RepID=UPI0036E146F9